MYTCKKCTCRHIQIIFCPPVEVSDTFEVNGTSVPAMDTRSKKTKAAVSQGQLVANIHCTCNSVFPFCDGYSYSIHAKFVCMLIYVNIALISIQLKSVALLRKPVPACL